MQIKENVYEKTAQTEDGATAQEEKNRDQEQGKNASTVLGKFKDVDALARAYGALEAEFTRRSQRLKELEKKAENWERDHADTTGNIGVEKLRKNARMRREETKQFDDFLREVGQAGLGEEANQPVEVHSEIEPCVEGAVEQTTAEQVVAEQTTTEQVATENMENVKSDVGAENAVGENSAVDMENSAEEVLETRESKAMTEETRNGGAVRAEELSLPVEANKETELSSEELFAKACQNEEVRLKIIGEYLVSIGKSGAPVTAGRGGLLVTPPVKARNIDDAGGMALQYFKKGLQE
jgi:hypothetical protein